MVADTKRDAHYVEVNAKAAIVQDVMLLGIRMNCSQSIAGETRFDTIDAVAMLHRHLWRE